MSGEGQGKVTMKNITHYHVFFYLLSKMDLMQLNVFLAEVLTL